MFPIDNRLTWQFANGQSLLLRHFGGVDAVSKASIEDLHKVPGINLKVAENIFYFFRQT